MQPTRHPPGSPGKIDAMMERAEKELPLWHPQDEGMAEMRALRYVRPILHSVLISRRERKRLAEEDDCFRSE